MKLIVLLFSFFFISQSFAQNYILPDGEYMDTTVSKDTSCKDYHIWYYQVSGKYPESSFSTLKKVQAYLKNKNESETGSGYISFHFLVDCKGEVMKKIQVMQTDEQYKSTHFNKKLVNKLFAFFNTMHTWKVGKLKDGEAVRYHAFIAFKINNGKVVNIIP